MTGTYEIEVYNRRVHYYLRIGRKITILRGDSATGKTELIRLVGDYEAEKEESGVTLRCDRECRVLTPRFWELSLRNISGSVIFIDEPSSFIRTERFATLVKESDNYYVIVTRDDIKSLPYGLDDIYGLRNVKTDDRECVCSEMYRLNAG